MKLSSVLRSLVSVVLAGAFLYLAFRGTNFTALWSVILQANIWWCLSLVPVAVLSHVLRAVRWRYLLEPFTPRPSLRNMFSAVMIGYAVNNVLTRVGEIVRGVVIGKLEGISRSAAVGTIVIERILDFLTFSFIVGITLALYPASIDPFVSDPEALRPLFLAGSVGSTAIFLLLFLKIEAVVAFFGRFRRFLPPALGERVGGLLESFRSGLSVGHLRTSWHWMALWSLAIWGLYALGLYLPFFIFDSMAGLQLGFGSAVVLLTISSIAFALPAPGAMGTYHSFLTIALVKLYGVDQTSALGFSVITHEIGFILVMVIGAYFYIVDHPRLGNITGGNEGPAA